MRSVAKSALFEAGTLLLFFTLALLGLIVDRFFKLYLATSWLLDFVGLFSMILGVAIRSWASAVIFHLGRGTPLDFRPTQALVKAGPYEYIRNPLYVGGYLSCLGVFLFMPSIFLLVLGLTSLPVTYTAAIREERGLGKRFGEEYRLYRQSVPASFPRIRGKGIE